ncbi:hypothetical protein LRS10_13655 [Phenylobacterium sp. J426]|uniref:hypothetical protein n=1 Tax=Phenylobacterium sp. J426 TaxID=2898439 RepID=UPI00215174C7|nr:hypothetical protein [Phenylobacterium sp. J426]MCR5875139.1 hypothetical protein [Phenylobacterium sp. J426]
MTYEAAQIMSRRGAEFELDRRRRDALATYAEIAAAEAGKPAQTWVRETWGFKVYEAKHLLAGNASETMWERILKQRGPHGGWRVALPILGAVIGEDIADHFQREKAEVAHERAQFAAREARLAALEAHARDRRPLGRVGAREAALQGRSAARERGVDTPRVGRGPPL